jgi:hypothetical protein
MITRTGAVVTALETILDTARRSALGWVGTCIGVAGSGAVGIVVVGNREAVNAHEWIRLLAGTGALLSAVGFVMFAAANALAVRTFLRHPAVMRKTARDPQWWPPYSPAQRAQAGSLRAGPFSAAAIGGGSGPLPWQLRGLRQPGPYQDPSLLGLSETTLIAMAGDLHHPDPVLARQDGHDACVRCTTEALLQDPAGPPVLWPCSPYRLICSGRLPAQSHPAP